MQSSQRLRRRGGGGARVGIGLLLLSLLASVALAKGNDVAAEEAVRRVFADYKAALVQGDGEAAVALVDAATLRYFEELRDLALTGSEEEVRARSFIERLLVVSMRHELGPLEMAELDLGDLIRIAVEEGWISPQSIAQLEMGEVRIDGGRAEGDARTRAQATGTAEQGPVASLVYEFVLEEGAWKFRFGSLVSSLDRLVSDFAAELGLAEDDLIFTLVESFSGRKVLPEVWERPE